MDNLPKKIKPFLLDLFFPKFCLGCNREGAYLCEDCKATLDISEFSYCLCNKNPLVLPPNQTLRQGLRLSSAECPQGKCPKCSSKKLSGLYFALPYKDPSRMSSGQVTSLTKKLIYQFKYEPYAKDLAKTLANLIIEHLILTGKNTDDIWQHSFLIPVPLDKNKLRNRGYNQSEELAKELSKILNVPVLMNNLIKIKSTRSQMELSGKEREKNLEGAFAINLAMSDITKFSNRHCEDPPQAGTKQSLSLSGKKVFLVDDVYTTGATMEECAKVLKQAGAKSVWGIAIAREE